MNVNSMLFHRGTKLPIIRQSEESECGLACIAMIASFYGFESSLANLRRKYNTSLRGMTLKTIVNIADHMGLMSRGLKVPIEDIKNIKLPAILHWDMNHFVVLQSVKNNKMKIYDPANGISIYKIDDFSKHYTGIALELQPSIKFEQKKEPLRLKINDLWGNISGLKKSLVQLLLLTLFLQLHTLASPFYLQTVIDEVLQKFNNSLLLILAIGFAFLLIINVVTTVLRSYISMFLGNSLTFQIATNLFKHLLSLPLDYFEKRHMGDINSRFQSIEPIKVMLTDKLLNGFLDIIMVITTLIMMMIYSPLLGVVCLGSIILYFMLRLIMFHTLKDIEELAIITNSKQSSIFMELVRSMTSLKLFGAENERHGYWQNQYAASINASVNVQRYKVWFDATQNLLTGLELVLIVYLAASMVMASQFTVGMIFAFTAYRTIFVAKAQSIITLVIDYRMLSLHLERISDIVYTEPEEIIGHDVDEISEKFKGSIELRNLSYQYSFESPHIIENMCLTVKAGESIAIVGETGCGKTTLLKIMTTLLTPQKGEILIDGRPIKHIGVQNYRKEIGVVMQDDGLMSGTIAQNIAFFDPEIDMQRVVEAAKSASVIQDIMELPMKFQSLIGEMGTALSGGQRQRLAIARALYRNPKILFMDEGTSHLDVGTEARVNQAIRNMGITRIIVAHRPETIRSADRVFICKDGILTEAFDEVIYGSTKITLGKKNSTAEVENPSTMAKEPILNS